MISNAYLLQEVIILQLLIRVHLQKSLQSLFHHQPIYYILFITNQLLLVLAFEQLQQLT